MKLARKLILALVAGIFAVMALNAYLRLQTQEQFFKVDSERDLRAAARALKSGIEAVWRDDGDERAQRFVQDVNLLREEIDLRWLWIDELGVSEHPSGLEPSDVATLHAGREVTIVRDTEDGYRRFMYWPLGIPGMRPAALELSESLGREARFIRTSQVMILTVAFGMAVVCGLIATAIGVWFVGRPMRMPTEKARRVGAGDLTGPLQVRQRDEIGELAGEINAMCERLAAAQEQTARETEARIQALEQLRHVDRLRTVGQLASGVAHELGTPLNVVSGHAGMIRAGDLPPQDVAASAAVIAEQTRRMTSIIRQLLDFSRRKGPMLDEADVEELVASTVDMLGPLAEKRGVELAFAPAGAGAGARADHNQLQQAIANLMMNAIQATPDGGRVRLSVGRRLARPPHDAAVPVSEYLEIAVTDAGPGIAAEHLPHVFEPFFTTKDVGEGTGLGLAVAYGIVREHGGWIEVESEPGQGSRFSILLPPVARAEQAARRAVA